MIRTLWMVFRSLLAFITFNDKWFMRLTIEDREHSMKILDEIEREERK